MSTDIERESREAFEQFAIKELGITARGESPGWRIWQAALEWQAARAQGEPSSGVPEWMQEISENLKTQNNRITADPLFVVFQKRDMVTLEDFDYDRVSWGSSDGEAPTHIQDELNELYDDIESDYFRDDQITLTTDEGTETWQRVAIKENDEFVTACFTEAGAKAYLESNSHNLRQPFIFVTSLYRNEEMKQIRDWLHTNQPDSGAGDGWISVKERHPPIFEQCLGWNATANMINKANTYRLFTAAMENICDISHWMPLPQPPKSKEDRGHE